MDFYSKIKKEQEVQKSHVNNLGVVPNEDFNKGVVDDLGFSGKESLIKKTGAEIKEKLRNYIINVEAEKELASKELESYFKEVGLQPMGNMDSWRVNAFKTALNLVPKKYSYSQMYPKEAEPLNNSVYSTNKQIVSVTPEQRDKMGKYNRAANDYVDKCIEIIKINVVLKNFKDKESYPLTIDVAAKLGFGE